MAETTYRSAMVRHGNRRWTVCVFRDADDEDAVESEDTDSTVVLLTVL